MTCPISGIREGEPSNLIAGDISSAGVVGEVVASYEGFGKIFYSQYASKKTILFLEIVAGYGCLAALWNMYLVVALFVIGD